MIHLSKISLVMERRNGKEMIPFSFKAVKKNGEIVEGSDCILISSFNENQTLNIKFPNGQVRKLRKHGIIELNGQEVVI